MRQLDINRHLLIPADGNRFLQFVKISAWLLTRDQRIGDLPTETRLYRSRGILFELFGQVLFECLDFFGILNIINVQARFVHSLLFGIILILGFVQLNNLLILRINVVSVKLLELSILNVFLKLIYGTLKHLIIKVLIVPFGYLVIFELFAKIHFIF